MVNLVY